MRRAGALLVLMLALLPATPSRAEPAADCSQVRNLDLQIRACTILIEERKVTGGNLALALVNRGNAYGMQKRYPQALADYAAAIALEPDDPLAFYNRANIHLDIGNSADAIADYSRAITVDPDFALAYFNRGLAREAGGDTAGAIVDYRRVLLLEPGLAKARQRLKALHALGK